MGAQSTSRTVGDQHGAINVLVIVLQEVSTDAKDLMIETTRARHARGYLRIQSFPNQTSVSVTDRFPLRTSHACHDHSRVESTRQRDSDLCSRGKVSR